MSINENIEFAVSGLVLRSRLARPGTANGPAPVVILQTG